MIERMPEVRTLSTPDKLALVTELRDDLASNPEHIPITTEQIAGSCQRGSHEWREVNNLTERIAVQVPCAANGDKKKNQKSFNCCARTKTNNTQILFVLPLLTHPKHHNTHSTGAP